MTMNNRAMTLIVRTWVEPVARQTRYRIEHLQTGESWMFATLPEAMAFIGQQLTQFNEGNLQ